MKFAAIDFGTNSTRLLIAECSYKNDIPLLQPVVRRASITQLGSTLHGDKIISDDAVTKTEACLEQYLEVIRNHNVENILAAATSVFRDASNGMDVKRHFEDTFDIRIQLLSGEDEARLMYAGITANRNIPAGTPVLCIDIGGGSCEFVYADGGRIDYEISLPIGCLRTKNSCFTSDPPDISQIDQAKEHICDKIPGALTEAARRASVFFAFGGTVTTLCLICNDLDTSRLDETEGAVLAKDQIDSFMRDVSDLTESQIGQRFARSLDKGRETVLRSGAVIFSTVMDLFGQQTATITNQGILYGLIKSRFQAIHSA